MIYKSPQEMQAVHGNRYFMFYMKYLMGIAYQLFEWENLPPGVDERFLEMVLHHQGRICFTKNPLTGDFIVAQGAEGGTLNIYGRPNTFNTVFPNMRGFEVDLFNFKDDFKANTSGVLIMNNFLLDPTIPTLRLFAEDLAHIKEITRVNVENQRTPWVGVANDKNYMSMKKFQQQLQENTTHIVVNDKLDLDSLKYHDVRAPFVADKLNEHLTFVWGDLMTYLGIGNANVLKKERMITSEVNSNEEQTTASENIWLVARQQACDLINELFDLNVSVKIRTDVVKQLEKDIQKEVVSNG